MPTTQHITRAFQWDLARQVERLDFLLGLLPRYAEWGYQELYVHLEDAVEYPSLPGVARPDAYSYKQFARLVEAATAAGIRVVPIVNLLGHTQYLIKTPELRDLNELRDAAGGPLAQGQICPLHPHTLETADKLLRDLAPFCTAGKVHVGLDESFHLGKCPRCRADVERHGLGAHFAGYVKQLERLTAGRGLRLGMWADMLALLPEAIPLLPRNVIAYDWYYYPFARHPRVELRNFAEVDLAAPLQARGIEYWGCPMNGSFRYEPMPVFGDRLANVLSWWKRCQRVGAGGFLVTSWEANRLAIELTTAVDAAAACLWLDPEIEEPQEMLARGFERVFGERPFGTCRAAARRQATRAPQRLGYEGPDITEARRLARAALACDEFAFAGYHRWQINDRWDVCAARDGSAPYAKELRALERICRSLLARSTGSGPRACRGAGDGLEWHGRPARGLNITGGTPVPQDRLQAGSYNISPPALTASLAFRLYLAQRDVFVRRAAEGVFQLRQLLTDQVAASASEWCKQNRESRRPRNGETSSESQPFSFQRFSVSSARGHLKRLLAETSAFAVALRTGRAAARTMWGRSRDPLVHGPNEQMLDRDTQRLREWRRWLQESARNPGMIWQATPVCGAWQLLFTVHNFAPALQKVVGEQQKPDGTWETIHGLHTIEFRAFAARPRTRISREFSVPVDLDSAVEACWRSPLREAEASTAEFRAEGAAPSAPPEFSAATARRPPRSPDFRIGGHLPLRLAVRGVGQVAISRVELTDGVTRFRQLSPSRATRQILGCAAPHRGFPAMDFEKNTSAIDIRFDC
jgi:hypothetical protein